MNTRAVRSPRGLSPYLNCPGQACGESNENASIKRHSLCVPLPPHRREDWEGKGRSHTAQTLRLADGYYQPQAAIRATDRQLTQSGELKSSTGGVNRQDGKEKRLDDGWAWEAETHSTTSHIALPLHPFFPLPQLHPSLTCLPLQTPKSSLVYTPTTFFQLLLYSQLHSQRDRPTTRITGKCGWKDEKKNVEKVGLW